MMYAIRMPRALRLGRLATDERARAYLPFETERSTREPGAPVPILVTGMPRSGTTWVGRMLEASGCVGYISEPLNLVGDRNLFRGPILHWFTYITSDNERDYLRPFGKTLGFDYPVLGGLRAVRSPSHFLRILKVWRNSRRNRGRRPLIKEPHAVLSAEWFARRLGCDVVITVRHPAAVVSSWKRLEWVFDFDHLLRQPLLMKEQLAPFRRELEDLQQRSPDPIVNTAMLWRIVYSVVSDYKERHPAFSLVRLEDLSLDPLERFGKLFAALGLPFKGDVQSAILKSTSSENPSEVSVDEPYSFQLNSKANLENWKERLTPGEIERIREIVEDVSATYYSDADWA